MAPSLKQITDPSFLALAVLQVFKDNADGYGPSQSSEDWILCQESRNDLFSRVKTSSQLASIPLAFSLEHRCGFAAIHVHPERGTITSRSLFLKVSRMKFKMSRWPPPGTYAAEYTGMDEFTERSEFGRAVVLRFKITAGDLLGQEATRICSAKLSKQSNLAKFALALKGGPILAEEEVDFDYFVASEV